MQNLYKRITSKANRRRLYFFSLILFLSVLVGACVSTIVNIDQPGSVIAGDSVKIVLDIQWKETNNDHNDRQVIGICMPKSWNAGSNTTMYLTSDLGDATMSRVPTGSVEPSSGLSWSEAFMKKFGIGPNLIDDMEWVVFWSDIRFFVPNQSLVNGKIHISIKSATDNLMFKPGYAMCEDADGLSDGFAGFYTNAFGPCLEVLDGEGDLVDFCNPQIGVGEPSFATDNDIITIRYNGLLDTTALANESEIFFCAKAITSSGDILELCDASDASKMRVTETKRWRLDLWPRKYFNLQDGQTLVRLEYYFTDRTGSLKTGYANTEDPFVYNLRCNQ